jgi:hypothetical protein
VPRTSAYEPKKHRFLEEGWLFVPTAGARVAPEILVLELFRDVFFDTFARESTARQLTPAAVEGSGALHRAEIAVTCALRGRRKSSRQSHRGDFYAPAYPCLARHAWLRRKSDRVVRDFLLAGPMAQYYLAAR